MRLDRRLRELFPEASGRAVKQWIERGRVRVGGRVVRRGDVTVTPGERVDLGPPAGPGFPPELRLVFEDDQILVIDKPPGLLTIATDRERERTAYRMLAEYVGGHGGARDGAHRGGPRLFIVHRLDRETSGLLVFAKSAEAKRRLQHQFERRTVERRYVAVVEGRVAESRGRLRSRLVEDRALRVRPTRDRSAGREAITEYQLLARGESATLLELALVTGRRAQIRAQLAAAGHPIVGDHAYGARNDPLRRLCLHATRLAFTHPDGRAVAFESRMSASFARLVRVR